jgi:hypothetical protein
VIGRGNVSPWDSARRSARRGGSALPRHDTEEFVRLYERMDSKTGNMPSALPAKLNGDPELSSAVQKLASLWRDFNESPRRIVHPAHAKFHHVLKEYEKRWQDVVEACCEEQRKIIDEQPKSIVAPRVLLDLASDSSDTDESSGEGVSASEAEDSLEAYLRSPEAWRFESGKDSAADLILACENWVRYQGESGRNLDAADCSRFAQAMQWMRRCVGLDLKQIERRWKEIRPIVVKEQVSNQYSVEDSRSLFGYLDQIRLAYMIGADFAAIAMCRAVTEILIVDHYNRRDEVEHLKLSQVIKKTQEQHRFSFLESPLKLLDKVNAANDILHFNRPAKNVKEFPNRTQRLVREWIDTLREMIDKAPPGV